MERGIVMTGNIVLGHLEKRLMAGEITEVEYKKRKAQYVDALFELYVKDIITFDELQDKLNR